MATIPATATHTERGHPIILPTTDANGTVKSLALAVNDLKFAYSQIAAADLPPVLEHVTLNLPRGARCILVGANGAGKSTLLQILAGKRLTRSGAQVLGEDVFFKTPEGVTYLGTEWAANPVVRSDLVVSHFLDSVGGYRHKERRDRLLDIMDVDLKWHMHEVSDGERRRVQIVSGLMAPWEMLLLDEVTVDLDVLVRSRLLAFLVEECETRNATILYATHIFDGLDTFPTHLCHLQLGSTVAPSPMSWPIKYSTDSLTEKVVGLPEGVRAAMQNPDRAGSKLLEVALAWLGEDKVARDEKELRERGERRRGPKKNVTDSEVFYRKYDYSH